MTEGVHRIVEPQGTQEAASPIAASFWDEVAVGAPRLWFITSVVAAVASVVAVAGDWASVPPEWHSLALAVRASSILYFLIGVWLSSRRQAFVARHYRGLMLGIFPAVALPVAINGALAQEQGNLYWFGILQLELTASTFFLIPTPLLLAGIWTSTVFYIAVRLACLTHPSTNEDANVVIGLVIFGFIASFTHRVILRSRQEGYAQRLELHAQHRDLEERVRVRTHDLVEASKHLETSIAEKEVLLREVHHRAKNNMQVLTSLMRLQANNAQSEAAQVAFRETEHRIRAMALVHEKLYQSQDLSRIHLRGYLAQLVGQLVPAYTERRVRMALTIDEVDLPLDIAVPCGLIVNELVSNATRHAFANVAQPQITLTAKSATENGVQGLELCIADNGVGLPPGFDPATSPSLGLKLVRALAESQLRGTFTLRGDDTGTVARVWIPEAA